ncbi:MAG: ABC transporter ATP-binding protein [Planctomycetia bacterium]|nr:MAG: ABC transporter ATP-binding protein [Planctomycetia bacterium]
MRSSRQRYAAFRAALRRGALAPPAGVPARADRSTPGSRDSSPAGNRPPGAHRARAGGWPLLRGYVAFLRPFAGGLALVFALALTVAGMSLVLPRVTMHVIDHVIPGRDAGALHRIGAALLAWIVLQQSIDLIRNLRVGRLNARVMMRLRQRLFYHLLRLPLRDLAELKTGGVAARLSGDVDQVANMMHAGVLTPGVALAKIAATLGILVWINWQMALAAALALPPMVLLNLVSIRRIRPIYRSVHQDRTEISARVVETFGGVRVVRAFRQERAEARRFATAHHTLARKQLLARDYECVVGSLWGLLLPACGLLVVWLGGSLVIAGGATLGGIMAFQMYLMMLLMPVSTVVQSYGEVQQALAALERVFDLLNRPADKPDRPAARDLPPARGRSRAANAPVRAIVDELEFDGVSFGYDPAAPVLQEISLRVPGGSTVALVGPSGAGKTTLTNLVARFHDPDVGVIRLNGVDLRDIRLADYRALLGVVQQDVFLFDGTIAENIAYARPRASAAQIMAAAQRANAMEFIERLEGGMQAVVGERGVRLSGGQAQRISIARALLADPQILILDEATSNLDSASEQLIQEALRELCADRTTFVIAHRLSTVMDADLIVVLEGGRVVEFGAPGELLTRDGRYREMLERQMRGGRANDRAVNWV